MSPRRQALLALAHLRCGDTCSQLAAPFHIGIATVYRYIREAVEVLSAPPSHPPSNRPSQQRQQRHS
ncbi:transposase family protein [Streptomyces canus]